MSYSMQQKQISSPSKAISRLFSSVPRPIHLHEPSFTKAEEDSVLDCVRTGWVSSAGAYVEKFAATLADYTGAYAVPVVNGTAALHLGLHACGIGRGDEVLMPSLTFVATANAVHYCGAIPHFVDVDPQSLGIDPVVLKKHLAAIAIGKQGDIKNKNTGRPIKAVLVAHILGFPAQIDAIKSVCDEFGLILAEDAAESLGTFVGAQHTGTFGRFGALSFNGNKIITTGGGGAVLTRDKTLAERILHLSTTARRPDPYAHNHDEVGFNYRMPNINAALGFSQMHRLEAYIDSKRDLATIYADIFEGEKDAVFMKEPAGCRSNYWMCSALLPSEESRNNLIDALSQDSIFCRGMWTPMHALPMYRDCPQGSLSTTEDLTTRIINLPSSPGLGKALKECL